MMSHVRNRSLTAFATVAALGLAMGPAAIRAKADQWDKKTILTVNQPIQVRNTYLEPGTYVFKLLESQSNRHVVQIFNADQSRIIDTVMAVPNYRMQPTGKSRFAFWETPPGSAKALRAWFYPGDNYGQEFPYPKNLRELEVAAVTTTSSSTSATTQPQEPVTELESTPTPAPTHTETDNKRVETASPTAEVIPAPAPRDQNDYDRDKELVAQNTTPAPQAQPMESRATSNQSTTRADELPKTGSPYPVFGLLGLASLAMYGVSRYKQL